MKSEEEVAQKYLAQQRLGSPIFEPNGNIPPDFTLSSDIAIEVRRLNRTFSNNKNKFSEEVIYIPFRQMVKDVLATFDRQYDGRSYWISIDYSAPFIPSKSIRKQLEYKLKTFLDSTETELPYTITINHDVSLHVFESKPIVGRTFIYMGSSNIVISARGIAQLYIDNIQGCITEKSNKVEAYRRKYSHWQLLLVDYMQWSLSVSDVEKIKGSITDLGLFDNLSVISYDAQLLFKI